MDIYGNENDLKQIVENLNQAQKLAGFGSCKYDAIQDKIYLSEEVYQIYGIDPLNFNEEYKSLLELIHPEDQIRLQNSITSCLTGKSCYQIEYRIPQLDGSQKFVMTKGEPIFDDEQQVVGILEALQDITEKKQLEDQLRKNYENLVRAQGLAHIGSWEMDIAHGKNFMSEEAYRIYGITSEEIEWTYEEFLKFVHPDDIDMIKDILENPPKEHSFDMEFRIIKSDGSIRNVYQLMELTYDNDENLTFINGTIQDITEKKDLKKTLDHTQEKISKMQKQYEVLVQDSNDIFQIITPDGRIKYISQAVEKIIGYDPNTMKDTNIFDYFEGNEKIKLIKMLKLTLNISGFKVKEQINMKSRIGNEVFLELTMSNLLSEPAIQGIVLKWSDITGRVEMERNIEYIATHDELTKLPNSVYFNNQMILQCEDANEKGYSFGLIMLDIDGFKFINDSLGYQLVDQLMIQITERLKNFIGDETFICRYSSDQFAIIATGINKIEEYDEFARGVIDLFLDSFKLDQFELYITICMGISIYPDDGQNIDSLKKHANIALFQSKNQGKNTYQFHSPELDIKNYKQFVLRNDLRKVIDNNQLKVYYQPLVNLQTSEIIAAEALIRWEHPTWGMVPPNEFISIAEDTGFIINIGKWILREVCSTYKQWIKDGLTEIKVSINYSSIQFYEKDFVENIKDIIDEFKLDPHFLIIEIIESVLINNFEQVNTDIKSLQSLGIQVALDDFGTGFSSLEYLNKFNIDILKIDRTFIKNVPYEETTTIITKAVINMARELRIKLVAEGIETGEQLSFLKKLNCNSGQGYLYSKPVPQQEFLRLLAMKKCLPSVKDNSKIMAFEERRIFFRIQFPNLLEAAMTIIEIKGKKTEIGNTKVVIKNMGPGGLCFISNIILPIKRDVILQFNTLLLGEEIRVYGCPVWTEELVGNLYEYGIKFTYDQN